MSTIDTTARSATKLALEALENAEYGDYDKKELNEAITALQKALAQERSSDEQPAQQEPYPFEEMQEEILRLSKIISTNAFYQAGHANALEWAEEMAVLEDPRTSDWVYDDPHELAKALRKGPDFWPTTQPAPVQQDPVALQMDVIVVNLVREGVNKHRARELAEHFIKHTSPPTLSLAQRKPLTYVDLRRIANQCGLGANEVSARTQATVDNFARAIEAAHGIGEKR